MTVVCPVGHTSTTTDYCDQCGAPISMRPVQPTEVLPVAEEADTSTSTSPAVQEKECPRCKAMCSRSDLFCENCGHDFGASPTATGWEITVRADPEWFERSCSKGVSFPNGRAEVRLPLEGARLQVGRSQTSADENAPDIALEDPGISRKHAVLERQTNGSYAVTDVGSTNGTFINDDSSPIGPDAPVPLANDDKIRIGAWTTITVRAV